MGRSVLTWREAEDIIDGEVRRFRGTLPGYDRDDLKQECRIVAAACIERVDPTKGSGAAYVKRACHNVLTKMLRASTTLGRCPHDAWGRPRLLHDDLDDYAPVARDNPEKLASDREQLAYLCDRLDPRDWRQLVSVFVEGARIARGRGPRVELNLVRAHAESILARIHYRVRREQEDEDMPELMPVTDADEIMECHYTGEQPQGYDPAEHACTVCPDKFTCLPGAIEMKLISIGVSADREVEYVLDAGGTRVAYDEMIERMKRRIALKEEGEKIPNDLLPTWEGLVSQADAPSQEPAPTGEPAQPELPGTEDSDEKEATMTAAQTKTTKAKTAKAAKAAKAKAARAAKAAASKPNGKGKPNGASASAKAAPAKPAKPPKKPAKAAPAKPKKPAAPLTLQAPVVARNGDVKLSGTLIGSVKKEAEGWGWWSANGKAESLAWLDTKQDAVNDLVKAKCTTALLKNGAKAKGSKAKPAKPAKPRDDRPDGWPTMANGKPLPKPKKLTEEEMVKALSTAQAKLGANIDLDYGLRIVRRQRKGDCIVEITPNGFKYSVSSEDAKAAGFKSRPQFFGSLSSVAMWHEHRMVSGNDFFNIAKHNATEIRNQKGHIVDRKGGVG